MRPNPKPVNRWEKSPIYPTPITAPYLADAEARARELRRNAARARYLRGETNAVSTYLTP